MFSHRAGKTRRVAYGGFLKPEKAIRGPPEALRVLHGCTVARLHGCAVVREIVL